MRLELLSNDFTYNIILKKVISVRNEGTCSMKASEKIPYFSLLSVIALLCMTPSPHFSVVVIKLKFPDLLQDKE